MVVGSLLTIFFLKIVLFCGFFRVSIGLRCFNLRIMNPDLSGLRLISFLFQCVIVAATIFFPPKKGHKGFHIFTKLFFVFYSVTRSQN
jgi:ethanolamine transporter EutH